MSGTVSTIGIYRMPPLLLRAAPTAVTLAPRVAQRAGGAHRHGPARPLQPAPPDPLGLYLPWVENPIVCCAFPYEQFRMGTHLPPARVVVVTNLLPDVPSPVAPAAPRRRSKWSLNSATARSPPTARQRRRTPAPRAPAPRTPAPRTPAPRLLQASYIPAKDSQVD